MWRKWIHSTLLLILLYAYVIHLFAISPPAVYVPSFCCRVLPSHDAHLLVDLFPLHFTTFAFLSLLPTIAYVYYLILRALLDTPLLRLLPSCHPSLPAAAAHFSLITSPAIYPLPRTRVCLIQQVTIRYDSPRRLERFRVRSPQTFTHIPFRHCCVPYYTGVIAGCLTLYHPRSYMRTFYYGLPVTFRSFSPFDDTCVLLPLPWFPDSIYLATYHPRSGSTPSFCYYYPLYTICPI